LGIFGKPTDQKSASSPSQSPAASPNTAPAAGPAASRGTCVIGPKTVVKGELLGDEDVVVEGKVEGHVRLKRDLRVSPGGAVHATVDAQSIIVSGEVLGDCTATQRVEIQASGRLTGNIRAPKIVIAEGAVFKGNSDMSGRKDDHKDKAAVS